MFVSADDVLGLSDSALQVKFKETRWTSAVCPACWPDRGYHWYPLVMPSRKGRLSAQTSPRCMLPWLCEYVFARWMNTSSSGLMLAPPTCSLPGETGEACSMLLFRRWRSVANMLTCSCAENTPVQMFVCLTLILFIAVQFHVFNAVNLVLRLYDSLTFAPTGYFMVLYIQSSRNKVYLSIRVSTAVMCASGKLSLVPQDVEMWSPGRSTEPHSRINELSGWDVNPLKTQIKELLLV